MHHMQKQSVIIGFGPAGMFAALELLERGYRPVIFERGKRIEERTTDVENFFQNKQLDLESNVQFGEGGAGSFSDGKLFSRKHNTEIANKVLETFVKFGAPSDITYKSKPHLGTDVIRVIVKNIREYMLSKGGEIHFSSKLTGLISSGGEIKGVIINNDREFLASKIFLAIGHSARDTFEMLHQNQVSMQLKPIAVGLRIEHPAELINQIRNQNGEPEAATYSFSYADKETGRGVFTFCMCPGGEVVNASSESGRLVLNGMSYAKRNSKYSNAAIVVACKTADYGFDHPLAGINFQKEIESKAYIAGGSDWKVPAQNLQDFLADKESQALLENSCRLGVRPAQLSSLFPAFVSRSLKTAFHSWKNDYPLFVGEQAILLGAETRTTCPISFPRNDSFDSVNANNLIPIGEGSGHAGGITSSAVDAIKAVRASVDLC